MKQLNAILILILFSPLNSFGQKINSYKQKIDELIISMPSEPEKNVMGDGAEIFKSATPKGQLMVIKMDVSNRKNELPSKDSLNQFYTKIINERFDDWNIPSGEIDFFKIKGNNAVFFPGKDTHLGNGFCVLLLINNSYYMVWYLTKEDRKEFEYSKKEFMNLIKLDN